MVATIKSMTKYLSLVEGHAKAAEDLNQVLRGQQPSPRLFKRLKKVEEALEAQFKRMHDVYAEAIVLSDLKLDEDNQDKVNSSKTYETIQEALISTLTGSKAKSLIVQHEMVAEVVKPQERPMAGQNTFQKSLHR